MLTSFSLAFGGRGTAGDGGRERERRSSSRGNASALAPEAQAPGLGELGDRFVFNIAVAPSLGCLPDSPECTQHTRKRVPRAQNPR